jgi:tRNA A-37 threonylcarbamoyl transferase component Bud32
MIGRTLGCYRIVEQIGSGGMATIYKAYDAATDRYVAVKTLPEYYSNDASFRQRFEREAKAIAQMEHIHILPIFTFGEEDRIAYLVMRYLPTGTLADRIGRGRLPLAEASRILSQLASALDYAHKHGILHRDVKPSNVLLDDEGNVLLTDFGIAKIVAGTSDLTGSGLIGTPNYMSPEQCQGSKKLTPASDQYSLGVVLYEMLTGCKPYQAETPVAVVLMHLNDPLPPPRRQRPEISEVMEAVLFKALAKQPELRYPSCAAMAEAFARAVSAAEPITEVAAGRAETAHSALSDRMPGKEYDEGTLRVDARPGPEAPVPVIRPGARLPARIAGLAAVLIVVVAAIALFASGAFTLPPVPSPTPASLIAGLNGMRNIFICEDDPAQQTVCITSAAANQKPVRIKADVRLFTAAWSPDGEKAVITGMKEGGDERYDMHIYVVDMQDGSIRQIEDDHSDVFATWSPDGQWLAFHSSGALSIIRPDGTDYRQIWRESYQCILLPEWSPDSKRIVFTSVRCGDDASRRQIFVATLDGIIQPIAEFDFTPSCNDPRTAFSPDGRLIALVDSLCHAVLLNPDGTPTNIKIGDFNPTWTGSTFPQWGVTE